MQTHSKMKIYNVSLLHLVRHAEEILCILRIDAAAICINGIFGSPLVFIEPAFRLRLNHVRETRKCLCPTFFCNILASRWKFRRLSACIVAICAFFCIEISNVSQFIVPRLQTSKCNEINCLCTNDAPLGNLRQWPYGRPLGIPFHPTLVYFCTCCAIRRCDLSFQSLFLEWLGIWD